MLTLQPTKNPFFLSASYITIIVTFKYLKVAEATYLNPLSTPHHGSVFTTYEAWSTSDAHKLQ